MPGDVGQPSDTREGALTDALSSLKRTGCNLLLVGAVAGETNSRACRRMLGDADLDPRSRVVVFTDADGTDVTDRLPDARPVSHDGTVTLLNHHDHSRSAVAQDATAGHAGPAGPGGLPEFVEEHRVDATDLSTLGDAIVETVDDVEAAADGLSPAELRLCVDSLLPLLEAEGEEAVFRFVHAVTGRVRQADGLAHYHLPVDPDDRLVALLSPLFDAVVEVRRDEGYPQQRWHLRDAGISTEWLAV